MKRGIGLNDWVSVCIALLTCAAEAILFVATGSGAALFLTFAIAWLAFIRWKFPKVTTWTITFDL